MDDNYLTIEWALKPLTISTIDDWNTIQVLTNGDQPSDGGRIILITDGEENVPPMIDEVTPDLVDGNVIVYGLAFGNAATKKIEDLCAATGGKGWSYNEDHLTQSLDSMLDEIFQTCVPLEGRPVIVSVWKQRISYC